MKVVLKPLEVPESHTCAVRALNTHWKQAFGNEPLPATPAKPKPERNHWASSSLLQVCTSLNTWKKLPVCSGTARRALSTACSGGPCFVRGFGAGPCPPRRFLRAGCWEHDNGHDRGRLSEVFLEKPLCFAAFRPLLESPAPGSTRHFTAAVAGGSTRRGLLTGGAGWRRRLPRPARAGGASAGHRVQAPRAGSRPGGRARAGGTDRAGAGVRRPGRGGAPERSPSLLTSGRSSSSLGLHHFLRGGVRTPLVVGRPRPAGVGAGARLTGKTAVGRRGWRLGKQKDGGGDGKQSGEVCVEGGEAGGAAAG